MKSICPHCKQEYPELPDEYQGMTLECSVCKQQFVCENLQAAQQVQPQMVQPYPQQQYGSYPPGVPPVGYPPKKSNVLTIVLIIVGSVLALFGIVFVSIFIALGDARERARRSSCISNMKQIGNAIMVYACDNREKFPDDLHALKKNEYLTDEYVYLCPSSDKKYIYLGKGLISGVAGSETPILIEYSDYHDKYVNILYADGSVRGHTLSRNYSSCTDLLTDLFPGLAGTKEGRTVLENARL